MSGVVTIPELLDGHTVLDVECLDRIYLNGYVPALQVGGQVVTFLHGHLGKPVASPAVIEQIGTRFRQAVARFAENNDIPMVKFSRSIRKIDVMRPLLARAARTGRGPPRAFRTADLELIHAARCRFRYSLWTSCGVLYPSAEWRRVRLYRSSMYRAMSSRAFLIVG
jgi:hypothetical protein